MLSISQIKQIKNLQAKKYRKEHNLFIAEGNRLVQDLLQSSIQVSKIFYVESWTPMIKNENISYQQISKKEMERISGLSTPSEVLAVVKVPVKQIDFKISESELVLVLDDVQDPGNLGTIIRLADWFGIEKIICTSGTADAYSPKVVQSTMGSIARVAIAYYNPSKIVEQLANKMVPVYGTFLKGENIFHKKLSQNGVIILGNEGNGISKAFESIVSHRITIPSFSKTDCGSESLNVAVAAAIVCSEFRRRTAMDLT
jgi:TrmH family RNA methyltransferase